MVRISSLDKNKRVAKSLEIVMKVLYKVGMIFASITAIAGIALLFASDKKFLLDSTKDTIFSFTLDNLISLNLKPHPSTTVNTRYIYITIMFVASIMALVVTPIFKQLELILNSIKVGTPFIKENALRLKKIGVILVIGSFVTKIAEAIVATRIIYAFSIDNININLSVNTSMLLTGFLVLILSSIFNYGTHLQNEYDSTI